MHRCEKSCRATVTRAQIGQGLQCMSAAAVFNICRMAFLIGPLWLSVAVTAAARADTTVLVGTHGNANSTLTGGIRSFAVTNSGSTWTQSGFNSDGWLQTIEAGVNGLAQDIYGNVYAAVNTGTNATRGIRIYRQTGGASVGYLNSTWGSGNLTGNSPDGLAIGADGRLYATVPFGTGNNKLLSFNTTTLSGGQIQTGQGGTDTGLTGLDTPRGITVASDANFYIANRGTRQILRWTGSGTTATVLATNNTGTAQYQTVSWDAGGNRLLTASGGAFALVGSLTLDGAGSDASIRTTNNNDFSVGLAVVDGLVAFTQFTPGKVATATGDVNTQTDRVTGLSRPSGMLVLRDTRLWEGGVGSWATGANWRQGIGGTTGAATFTSGSGATSLPSVLTFTGTAGGTATNDVAGTVNVGGLNFAPGAGAYTLAGSSFTLAPNANIRNLSTNSQTISADIVLGSSQWIQGDAGSMLTISGNISGSGFGLTKTGLGTLLLTGSSSYSGATVVAAGGLLVNGQLGNTNITVNSGGLLGGSGAIAGGVTVAAGGTFSPGNSPGLISVGTLGLAGTTLMEIDGLAPRGGIGGYDATDVTGQLTYGGSLLIDFGAGITSAFADKTVFDLFNFGSYTGSFTSITTADDGSFYGGLTFASTGAGDKWTATKNSQTLEFTHSTGNLVIVPEPGAIALAGVGIAVAGWAFSRRAKADAALLVAR